MSKLNWNIANEVISKSADLKKILKMGWLGCLSTAVSHPPELRKAYRLQHNAELSRFQTSEQGCDSANKPTEKENAEKKADAPSWLCKNRQGQCRILLQRWHLSQVPMPPSPRASQRPCYSLGHYRTSFPTAPGNRSNLQAATLSGISNSYLAQTWQMAPR